MKYFNLKTSQTNQQLKNVLMFVADTLVPFASVENPYFKKMLC